MQNLQPDPAGDHNATHEPSAAVRVRLIEGVVTEATPSLPSPHALVALMERFRFDRPLAGK